MGLNRYCVQVLHQNLKGKFYISQVNCCGVSVASEQQHNQDLKRIYKREYEFLGMVGKLGT